MRQAGVAVTSRHTAESHHPSAYCRATAPRPGLRLSSFIANVVLICCGTNAHALDAGADVFGVWRTEDRASLIEIKSCGTAICGYLVSFPPVQDAATNDTLCRAQLLGGFEKDRVGRWIKGWVVDPEDNDIYEAAISIAARDELRLRAYVGDERFGRTVTWHRHSGAYSPCRTGQ
ncbi:MAG: DUF2147 domain-containing protein [Methyloceanibacter sp.]|nr:DUF2147 domain-containing protein [Methyloceanibacter sp.]